MSETTTATDVTRTPADLAFASALTLIHTYGGCAETHRRNETCEIERNRVSGRWQITWTTRRRTRIGVQLDLAMGFFATLDLLQEFLADKWPAQNKAGRTWRWTGTRVEAADVAS